VRKQLLFWLIRTANLIELRAQQTGKKNIFAAMLEILCFLGISYRRMADLNWLLLTSSSSFYGLVIIILATLLFFKGQAQSENLFEDFYANIVTELGSIAITVLILDQLNRRRDRHEKMDEFQKKSCSQNHTVATNAIEELRYYGYFTGKKLVYKKLNGNLQGVDLQYADLSGALLDGGTFDEANLRRAKLEAATLGGMVPASFLNCNLEQADMSCVEAFGAIFSRANISGGLLKLAKLQRADFGNASLRGVNFSDSILEGANFEGAFLERADFRGANLKGVRMVGASFENAIFNTGTTLPSGIKYDHDVDLTQFTDASHPNYVEFVYRGGDVRL